MFITHKFIWMDEPYNIFGKGGKDPLQSFY